jgi:uncharacterized membrane protein
MEVKRTIRRNKNFAAALIPSPELLSKYNSVMPGLADRIISQAEQQTAHRHYIEKKHLNANICKSILGLVFGFLIGLLGVGGGMYLTYMGFNVIGIIFSSATLVSLVMAFIYGSQSKKNVGGSALNNP